MRSGDEPSRARSPLRLRLGLACMGMGTAAVSSAWCAGRGLPLVAVAFGVVAMVAAADVAVVLDRIRRGPHWQPGPGVPPYQPIEPPRRASSGAVEESGAVDANVAGVHRSEGDDRAEGDDRSRPMDAGQAQRRGRYLALMGTCLFLLVNAWTWVRLVSVPAAVVMSAVAMVLPPIAAVVGSAVPRLPERPSRLREDRQGTDDSGE